MGDMEKDDAIGELKKLKNEKRKNPFEPSDDYYMECFPV